MTSHTMTSTQRHRWIDSARGIAVFLVVFQHATIIFVTKGGAILPQWLNIVDDFFTLMRMPTLCFISGLFISKSISSQKKHFWIERVFYFLHLYVAWCLMYILMQVGHIITGASISEVTESMYQWITLAFEINSGLWYLFALFIFYAYYRITINFPKYIHLAILVPLYILYSSDIIKTDSWGWDHVFHYVIFFMAGAWLGPKAISAIPKINVKQYIGITLVLFSAFALYEFLFAGEKFGYAEMILGPIGLLWLVKSCELIDRTPAQKITRYIGKLTLPIYILHVAVLELAGKAVSTIVDGEFTTLQQVFIPSLTPVLVTLVCLGIWKATYKIMPFLYGEPQYLKKLGKKALVGKK